MSKPYGADHKKYVIRLALHQPLERGGAFVRYTRVTVSARNPDEAKERWQGNAYWVKGPYYFRCRITSVKEVPWGSR